MPTAEQPDAAGIELRSPEAQDVLSRPPGWLVRWGSTLSALVLLLLVAVAYWVKYPDLVRGNLKVIARQWPKSVTARTAGRLMRLFVCDQQTVKTGERLAIIESTANPDEVFALEAMVDSLIRQEQQGQAQAISAASAPAYFQLGELQQAYQRFAESRVSANSLSSRGLYDQKRQALENDIQQLRALANNDRIQLELAENELSLIEAEVQSQERLLKQGYVSRNDYRQTLSRYLAKKQAITQAHSDLNNNQIQQNQKKQELVSLSQTTLEGANGIVQALHTLKSELEAWKQRFVVVAPATGRVSFLRLLQEGQPIREGQELVYVLPNGAGYVGEMYVGQYNFGKVRPSQRVIVKFAAYPYQEFGTVTGRVQQIADVASDTAWRVVVQFPQGLVTSTHRQLPFRNGMLANAEIVTQDVSLLKRLFYEVEKAVR
ncbi:HlyD family secretion protein [Spirosoma aerolatum]|uniref:HlyD family secretion protein n=1 Tax=Spirosoma aerolatum TaxID=1211326 RepID=UPI0009AEB84E|nr:HlyD family efflux transporter periplasmic adaptor subunit [Spirosoma aerolatum]